MRITGVDQYHVSHPSELFLVGQDHHDIGGIRRRIKRIETIGLRSTHVEPALWDIIGKDAGKPVYGLLGGTGDPVRAYASTGQLLPADKRIAHVEDCLEMGFEAVKLRITEQSDLETGMSTHPGSRDWASNSTRISSRVGGSSAARAARRAVVRSVTTRT
jgi:L-alanine-DL-glutamate epimerase-like enolase superfamily enzyme